MSHGLEHVSKTAAPTQNTRPASTSIGYIPAVLWRGFTRSQPELGQDRAYALVFGLSESGELVTRQIAIDPAITREFLTPFGGPHHRLDRPLETLPIDRTDAGRRNKRAPFSSSTFTPCSRNVGMGTPGTRSALDAQHA